MISVVDDTTGDTGDSIVHFLYSRDCWEHRSYLFNLWAKPLFTLASSPFSQFGMTGMKIFNSLVVAVTLHVSMLCSLRLKLAYWYLVPFVIVFSPFYGVHIFSGLTEYFYGLLLLITIYLAHQKKLLWAGVLCGFLPFARNEGVLPILLMVIYLFYEKKWKYLPFLAVGHACMGLLGALLMEWSPFWTLTTHVYDPSGSSYGRGDFWEFVKHIRYVMGWPNVILVITGLFFSWKWTTGLKRKSKNSTFWLILILGNFLGFYIGHALLYELGRFNSMGLPRVLHSVVPLAGVIAAYGLGEVADLFRIKRKWILSLVVIPLLIYFPFISRPGAHVWHRNVLVLPENEFIDREVLPFLKDYGYDPDHLFFNYPYLGIVTESDALRQVDGSPFMDKEKIRHLRSGDLYIWDHWFSIVEGDITEEYLMQNEFEKVYCNGDEYWKWAFEFCVFQKR